MRGLLAGLSALLLVCGLAAPAAAKDDTPDPEWVGVWQGSIGRLPIVACFDRWNSGEGRGSYYYSVHLKPIRLKGDETGRNWAEGNNTGEPGTEAVPSLTFTDITEERIEGRWRAGKRSLGIVLHRIPDGAEDYYDACASANFLAPRVVKPEFERAAATVGGFDFTRLRYKVPAHFEDVEIGGFTFAPTQPGDGKIIEWLGSKLPQGKVEDDFLQCLAGALTVHGVDGYYAMGLSPVFANDELLSIDQNSSDYCGGAHPNHWKQYFTFDRKTGAQLEPVDWFNSKGTVVSEYGSTLMQPDLRALIVSHWPQYENEPDECSGYAEDQEWWGYQIRRDGIQFQPDLPHVITPCEEEILVGWDELEPFLSDAGKVLRERAQR